MGLSNSAVVNPGSKLPQIMDIGLNIRYIFFVKATFEGLSLDVVLNLWSARTYLILRVRTSYTLYPGLLMCLSLLQCLLL